MHMLVPSHADWKMASNKTLTFKVTRKNPELIPPAEATPYEIKYLSDIDDQDSLRIQIPLIQFYRKNPSMEGKDPVNVIRAVAKALVFYYPLAGRLREYTGRKLVVECTGEGVVFVEADADIMLHHFGDTIYPPFPNLEELLLLHIPGSNGIINCPLLFFQVTRLRCGGFILAYCFNHTMCDGAGIIQFMSAVSEVARGSTTPSVPPVWERHILSGRDNPRSVLFTHPHEYDAISSSDTMVQQSFFFSAADISALRRSLPPHLQSCSKLDMVAACAWRCRTMSISCKPDEETRFVCVMDIRKRIKPPLPVGYYGNSIIGVMAVTTAEKLSKNPLHYAVELVRKVKSEATELSVTDVMEMIGQPLTTTSGMIYMVSDLTRLGFEKLEFGWGKAVYGGVAKGIGDWIPERPSWYFPFQNKMGEEEGIMVPVSLPLNAMEDFVKHLQILITTAYLATSPFITSPL